MFLGTPALGGVRPDVAAVHGDQFREAGFALTLQGLTPGTYDLAVFPWSNVTGAFAPPNVVRRDRAIGSVMPRSGTYATNHAAGRPCAGIARIFANATFMAHAPRDKAMAHPAFA